MIEIINKYIKLPIKQFSLNIKFIITSGFIIGFFIGFIFLSEIITIIFVPLQLAGSLKLELAITCPILLMLGAVSYQWKTSTLNRNEFLSNSSKSSYYISLILTILVVGNILIFILIALDSITLLLGLQLKEWVWEGGDRFAHGDFNLSNINFISILYAVELDLGVTFAIYFLIHRFFNNSKNYYIFILVFMILTVIFGGVFTNLFRIYSYVNDDGVKTIGIGANESISLFPGNIFYFSLIFPLYCPSILFQLIYIFPVADDINSNTTLIEQIHSNPFWFFNIISSGESVILANDYEIIPDPSSIITPGWTWRVYALHIDPWATIIIYGLAGGIINFIRNKLEND